MTTPLLTLEQQAWADHAHDVLYEGDTDAFLDALELDMDRLDNSYEMAQWAGDERLAQLAQRLTPAELARTYSHDDLLALIEEHHHTLPEPDPLHTLQHTSALQQALHDLVQHVEQIYTAVDAFQENWDEEFVVLSDDFDNHLHHLAKLCQSGLHSPERAHLNERQ